MPHTIPETRTLWFVRYRRPELLDIEKFSFPCQALGGLSDSAVRGGEVYMMCSFGRRTKPSLLESITQLLKNRFH